MGHSYGYDFMTSVQQSRQRGVDGAAGAVGGQRRGKMQRRRPSLPTPAEIQTRARVLLVTLWNQAEPRFPPSSLLHSFLPSRPAGAEGGTQSCPGLEGVE